VVLAAARDGLACSTFGVDYEHIQRQYINWSGWLGNEARGRIAVWLEIARDSLSSNFIPAAVVFDNWDQPGSRSKKVIPRVEAGYRGTIPLAMIKGVVAVDTEDQTRFERFDDVSDLLPKLHAFAAALPEPKKTIGS
jgi:hypothetical protein